MSRVEGAASLAFWLDVARREVEAEVALCVCMQLPSLVAMT